MESIAIIFLKSKDEWVSKCNKFILSLLQFITSYFSEKEVVFFKIRFALLSGSYQSVFVLVDEIVFLFFLNRLNNINFSLIGKQYCCLVFVFQIGKQFCYDKAITAVIGLVESRHIIDETFRT